MTLIKKPLLTGMRAVALLEAAKAVFVLLVGLGLLGLIHRDAQALAESLVRQSHLNPASKYPRIFIEAADHLSDTRLLMMAGLAALYAGARGIEAYGLWRERRWAEWFALASGALFVPLEGYELWVHPSAFKAIVLTTNVAVVAYMGYALRHLADQARELRNG